MINSLDCKVRSHLFLITCGIAVMFQKIAGKYGKQRTGIKMHDR